MRREAGMTLVEVMISAVVLSMVMLALSASLRTFATTYTAVEQSADRTARLREVTYFLRHVLREAYSPHQGAFHISGGEISWLAPIDRVGAASQVLLEGVRRFQVKAVKEASRNGYDDDDDELNDELPPGVQVEWELEDMSWPPLIVAFDGYEMVR